MSSEPTHARIVIDAESCVGSGNCTLTAPELFALDEERYVAVARIDELTDSGQIAAAKAAMEGCPAWAIEIRDS